jgi:hypothetical protein
MAIVLEKGHGKDGSPSHPYVKAHPTNYNWRNDIEQLTHKLVNREDFRSHIWINTYHHHPPGGEDDFWRWRDTTSFDVWGFGGRGDLLPEWLGNQVYYVLFEDLNLPDIWWIIWQGEKWSRFEHPHKQWFPDHFDHIHVTYLD